MRIGCLQFAPQVGDIDNNLNRADAVLSKANPQNLDLLVLPELAFSGYNFRSLQHITPYLEPTTSGITSLWARTTALKYDCVVVVGYPEKVDVSPQWPASPEYYNSAITVNADGETIANYRKSFLYYTDETWALEGPDGFFSGEVEGLGNVAMGICMDLNPYKFEAPWSAWEFGYHILHKQANLVILSMAWLTREDARSYSRQPKEPDMDTLSYWLARLEPVIRAETEGEIICVFANRTGTEEEATYAGTSAVLGIHSGEVKVYGILGRGEKELLVVDTNKRPQAKLISEPNSLASDVQEELSKAQAKQLKGTREEEMAHRQQTIGTRDGEKRVRQRSIERIVSPIEAQPPGLTLKTNNFPPRTDPVALGYPLSNTTNHVSPLLPNSTLSPTLPDSANTPTLTNSAITPISPFDTTSPVAYTSIGPQLEADHLNQLKASISQLGMSTAQPSPTFRRPASPKSRNASRNRTPRPQEPALLNHDLAQQEQISKSVSPALMSAPGFAGQFPSRFPNQGHQISGSPFGPRSEHTPPRPRSTVW